jgi:hypothetical protein
MSRYSVSQAIQKLDPQKDHQQIVFLSSCYDFPLDTTRALEFALFRTFCVPSIAALLDRTGEFQKRPQKRYDDTDIIVSELMEWGYDSDRGLRALRKMNQQHGRFAIANEDFLYVLSTFIYEPIRWNERFGWRLMGDVERLGYFYFWCEVGRRMNIRNLPQDYVTFEQFNRDYERQHCHFHQSQPARRRGYPRAIRELVSPHAFTAGPLGDLFAAGRSFDRCFRFSQAVALYALLCAWRVAFPSGVCRLTTATASSSAADQNAPPELPGGLCDRTVGTTGSRLM